MGRPSKYKPEYDEQAYKLTLLGATDKDLATFFEVEEKTINNWKIQQPSFLQSLKRGKDIADSTVGERLYQRATGYSHPDVKVMQYEGKPIIVPVTKHYPPDTTAAIFWLKNRQPEKWRDKQETDLNVKDIDRQLIIE